VLRQYKVGGRVTALTKTQVIKKTWRAGGGERGWRRPIRKSPIQNLTTGGGGGVTPTKTHRALSILLIIGLLIILIILIILLIIYY
jgi:hypothetical protein